MKRTVMPDYDEEFVRCIDAILTHIANHTCLDGFPLSVQDAYRNTLGDTILAGCAREIAEGNEPEGDVQTDSQIADRAVVLMQRVRDDIDAIIDALRAYAPQTDEHAATET